jgi:predicted ATPase
MVQFALRVILGGLKPAEDFVHDVIGKLLCHGLAYAKARAGKASGKA